MHRWLAIALGVALLAGLATVVTPAGALDQGSMGTLTPENTLLEEDYPPLTGTYPYEGAHAFAYYRPPTCRTVTYCDSVEADIEYPGGNEYLKEHFVRVTVTLSWDNPRTEDNPSGNDLDLFLWGDDGEATGAPNSKCRSPDAEECDNLHPEVVTLTDPSDTVHENADGEEPDPLFFTIVSDEGVNSGYTMRAEFEEFDLPPPPDFERPEREVSGAGDTGAGASTPPPETEPTSDDVGREPTVSGPDEERETEALVPGPDGELVERELPVLAAGQDLERQDSGGFNPFIPAGIVAALIGIGTAFLIVRRSREEREAEGY